MKNVFKSLFVILLSLNFYLGNAQSVVINEILADNVSINVDPDFSAFSDWIEITNVSAVNVSLSNFTITDDIADPAKWVFPVGTYLEPAEALLVWCDGQDYDGNELHTNFKLAKNGEQLILFNADQVVVDSITYGEQAENTSFGRKPDGNTQWNYFAEPTPNVPNLTTGITTTEQAPDLDFSLDAGFYNSTPSLEITLESGNGQIRYTTDGSIPQSNSSLYQNPISINSTQVIRAKAFASGLLPGDEKQASYFIGQESDLPVVSIIIEPDFLWDSIIGIYNDYMIPMRRGWERPARVEYFNEDGDKEFDKNSVIRLYGKTAIYYPQKSLAIFPNNPLSYPLFNSRENEDFHSFILRSSSDDWPRTMLRDALMQSVFANHLSIDYQAYEPSVLYLNGEYFGIHNIREKLNEDFLETYHNANTTDLDFFAIDMRDTSFYDQQGSHNQFEGLMEFVMNNDMSDPSNYEMVEDEMDMDSYMDYLISNFYFINTSWHHNIKVWRDHASDNKWRFMVYDLDRGMQSWDLPQNLLYSIDTTDVFFQHLRQNDMFKYHFINRCKGFMNLAFHPQRIEHFIDSLKTRITSEMPNHILRWKDECSPDDQCGVQSMDEWNTDLDILYNFNNQIHDYTQQHIIDFFGIGGNQAELTINIETPEMGKVYIDNVHYPNSGDAWTYYKQVPLILSAVPEPGYVFLGWEGIAYDETISLALNNNKTVTAKFGNFCVLPELITNDLTLGECEIYICGSSLIIDEGVTLTVDPGVQIWMAEADSIIVNGSLIINGSQSQNVILRPEDLETHWGTIYTDRGNIELNFVEYLNSTAAVLVDSGQVVARNCQVNFSPYFHGDIFSIHKANTTIENCVIYGPNDTTTKTDVIDCDEVTYAYISGNKIYATTDDGIDIGTHSSNITIENNEVYDCLSMGISIGEGTTAYLNRNIVANCEAGYQIHSASTGYIDHSTIFGNEVGIRCFHYENQGTSGGHAIVTNSIISASTEDVYQLFPSSTISFAYSLADTDIIPGEGNLNADPQFHNPAERNFNLLETSPCIDAGDPDFENDPDDSRTDIGALIYDPFGAINGNAAQEQIIIAPNPTTDQFRISMLNQNDKIKSIRIINTNGKTIFFYHDVSEEQILIKNKILIKGLYLLKVITESGKELTDKLVVI
jgi:hypothetical protein